MMHHSLGLTPGKKGFPMSSTAGYIFQNHYQRRKFLNWECGEEIELSIAPARSRLSVGIAGDTLSWYSAGQTREMQPDHPALKSINALNCQPGNSKGTFPKESIFIANSPSS